MMPLKIDEELFSFAFIPAWYDQLYALAQMAMSESWRFRQPEREIQNTETPILERYINQIFARQANEFNVLPADCRDKVIYIRDDLACLHTGLYTKRYKSIYMLFEPNRKMDTTKQWYFKAFVEESSEKLKYVSPLPSRPRFLKEGISVCFEPEWEVRINIEHIIGDVRNLQRIPGMLRDAWNLQVLLEAAVQDARNRAKLDGAIVIPQVFQGQLQFLIPIYLTNNVLPDMAMALSIMDGYYIGHTCLTCEMAYQNARLLGRPMATWLTNLVSPDDKDGEEDMCRN